MLLLVKGMHDCDDEAADDVFLNLALVAELVLVVLATASMPVGTEMCDDDDHARQWISRAPSVDKSFSQSSGIFVNVFGL